jgi:hypothetical protein
MTITHFFLNTDEDLFCPDLVRNCKSLPAADDDENVADENQDYVEIEELTSKLNLHNEVGLPTNVKQNRETNYLTGEMGQNVSLKRPKISLTWVLRDQQSQQHTQKALNWNVKASDKKLFKKSSKSQEKLFSEKYVSDNNLTDFRQNTKKGTDDTKAAQTNNNGVVRKNERMKKFHEKCCRQRDSPDSNYDRLNDGVKIKSLSQANLAAKNNSSSINNSNNNNNNYVESTYITSAQSDSGVNRRYRRRRKRSPKFGYNINNINEFLAKCSLSNPANIPVVLCNASILYKTRTGYQVETPLPLGMVVNSVFKNQNWLYGKLMCKHLIYYCFLNKCVYFTVQTPHGDEGYVNFHACLPLGIIQR